MKWTLPRFRYGLRTLLVVTVLAAIGAWFYTNRPQRQRAYRNQVARSRIDPYELSVAREANDASLPQELVAILGDSRLKHWGAAGAVKLLEGDQLASAGPDQVVRVWSTDSGRQVHTFAAKSLATSGDRKLLFLANLDGSIRCWDVAAAKELKTLGEAKSASSVNLRANWDGSWLIAEYRQENGSREIEIWSVADSKVAVRFRPATTGGGALSVTADGKLFTWESEGKVQVAETATGKVVRTIGPVVSGSSGKCMLGMVALSRDETRLFVGSAHRQIVVFDFASGQELERIGNGRSGVHSFALNASDNKVAFGGQDDLRIFFQWQEGEWKYWEGDTVQPGHLRGVDMHGALTAGSTSNGISLWLEGQVLKSHRLSGGAARSIERIVFHPNGEWLISGDSLGRVTMWDTKRWSHHRGWDAHSVPIDTLVFSANGSRLLTAAPDETAIVWDVASGREIGVRRESDFLRQVSLSPDGTYGVGGPRYLEFGTGFEVFDVNTGMTIRKVGPIQVGMISPPAWSTDGHLLAFVDHSQSMLVFDTRTWTKLGTVGKTRYSQQAVIAVWLSDNRRLVTTNWGRDEVHVVEVGKPTPVLTLSAGAGCAKWVAVHPTEEWIAVCGEEMPVQIWHLPTSKLVKTWQIGPPAGEVRQVAFSPDGHYLATVNGNGTVYVLSLDGVLK